MSTLLTPRPAVRDPFRVSAARQERLFGEDPIAAPEAAAPPAAPVREPRTETAGVPPGARPAAGDDERATTTAPTLEAAVTSLWDRLAAGETATCPVCDGPMEPRHSASAGVVGGRCRSCGSTLG